MKSAVFALKTRVFRTISFFKKVTQNPKNVTLSLFEPYNFIIPYKKSHPKSHLEKKSSAILRLVLQNFNSCG